MAKPQSEALDPREIKKRRREKILILGILFLFALTTYFEIRLSNLSSKLPFVNSIFFFGLINFNIILLMVLVFLIFRNVGKIFLERRSRVMGSKLKTKLVFALLSFSIIPTVILFLISSLYINSSFDKWFSLKVQNTLQAALEITDTYYKNTNRVAEYLALQTSHNLSEKFGTHISKGSALRKHLKKNVEASAVDSVEVYFGPLEEREYVSSLFRFQLTPFINDPPRLPLDVLTKVFSGDSSSLVQHIGGADLIRSVVPVIDRLSGEVTAAVAVTFVIPSSLVNRVDEISSVYQDYKDVNPLKYPMKSTYFLILIMMTLLIIFVSIWIGLYLARELTVPLERLVRGTQKISEGDFDFEVINTANDEAGRLTSSFNHMVSELKRHRAELEDKSLYVEAILSNVIAGVISVDSKGLISTVNPAAARILSLEAETLMGKKISECFSEDSSPLPALYEQVQKRIQKGDFEPLQKQFNLNPHEDSQSWMVTATASLGGVVFVIDDVSTISKVQREAAWREVARRIAHEIKNPLTPIKLSAQRLQKKFASSVGSEAAVFKECTDTIIKNVDELRDMVNEFSSFARFPSANPSLNNINEALRETVVLYEEAHRQVHFIFEPESRLPLVEFDRDQIKRVMINLLDNSVSALSNSSAPLKKIYVRTHYNNLINIAVVELEDNGPGMTEFVRSRLFEPYFSTKASGTGLGLAIVKRIISDHQGFIRVQSSPGQGTKFIIELPVNLIEKKTGLFGSSKLEPETDPKSEVMN